MGNPLSFIVRKAGLAVSRLGRHRRHRRVLRKGAVDRKAAQKLRASAWWGDEPRWYPGGTPPRLHNRITPLIDGERFFTCLTQMLEQAQHYVYIAGWSLTPYIPLCRDEGGSLETSRLLEVLSATAERVPVRILLWSGAGAIFQPTSRDVKEIVDLIKKGCRGDIECRADDTAHWTHCHHQKAIVVDGRVAFVGGMDLTTFSGDRWDIPSHPLRAGPNWHDVQLMVEGEVVADVEHNFRQRWQAVGGGELPHLNPPFDTLWKVPAQVVRTVPAHTYDFARRGEFGILHWYIHALRRAKRLIYLENQYLWSPHIMDVLMGQLDAHHDEPFRIVIILPAFAGDGRWDNDKHVQQLRKADDGRGILSIYSLYTSGPNKGKHPFSYRAIYVHAKVAVIDDEWLTVGSANLNNRGLVTDGEINLAVHDAALARQVRVALWAEHLAMPVDDVARRNPIEMVDHEWVERAARNAETLESDHRPLLGSLHSYKVGGRPSDLVLEDVQAWTFEL